MGYRDHCYRKRNRTHSPLNSSYWCRFSCFHLSNLWVGLCSVFLVSIKNNLNNFIILSCELSARTLSIITNEGTSRAAVHGSWPAFTTFALRGAPHLIRLTIRFLGTVLPYTCVLLRLVTCEVQYDVHLVCSSSLCLPKSWLHCRLPFPPLSLCFMCVCGNYLI